MAKVKYIDCAIYKRGIYVFIGTPKELISWCKKTFNKDKWDEEFNYSIERCTFGEADFHYGGGYGIVRLPKFPKTPDELGYTSHELLHATMWLLWYCGVSFDYKDINNEAFTYLLGYLMENTLLKEDYEEVKFS
jgi:hypothetical protein